MPRKHVRRDPNPTLFGQNLRRVRLAIGWSQDRMAQYLQLSSRVMVSWYDEVLRRFRELEAHFSREAAIRERNCGTPVPRGRHDGA